MSQRRIKHKATINPVTNSNQDQAEQERFYNFRNLSDLWCRYGELLEKSDTEDRSELVGDAYTQSADYLRSAIDIVEKDTIEKETPKIIQATE